MNVDVVNRRFMANQDIPADSELSFFYPSTEWEMAQPFDCWCGASKCFKKIQGAKFLTREQVKDMYINQSLITGSS